MIRVAEKISAVNTSATRAKGWHKIVDRVTVEARISASDIATSVAIVTSVVASSRGDDLHLLNPRVSGGLTKNGSNNGSGD